MKRKKFGLPVGVLALLMVVGLGAMGVAYTYWTKTLTINGSVETGNVDVEFTQKSTNDSGNTIDPGQTLDVGKCVATIDAIDDTIATITITNAYPGYNCTASYTIKNVGSIPIKLDPAFGGGSGITVSTLNATQGTPVNVNIGGGAAADIAVNVGGGSVPDQIISPLSANATDTFNVYVAVLGTTDLPPGSGPFSFNTVINWIQFNAP